MVIDTGPTIIYTISVTATNAEGMSATASITIHVKTPPGPIVVNITSPADFSRFTAQNQVTDSNGNYCGPVSFTATASGVPDRCPTRGPIRSRATSTRGRRRSLATFRRP